MLIDVENSGNRNLIKREVQKILKYKDRAVDVLKMWNVKRKSVPVITGATGTISQTTDERRTGRARNQGITKRNSHTGHCTYSYISESTKHLTLEITLHVRSINC